MHHSKYCPSRTPHGENLPQSTAGCQGALQAPFPVHTLALDASCVPPGPAALPLAPCNNGNTPSLMHRSVRKMKQRKNIFFTFIFNDSRSCRDSLGWHSCGRMSESPLKSLSLESPQSQLSSPTMGILGTLLRKSTLQIGMNRPGW